MAKSRAINAANTRVMPFTYIEPTLLSVVYQVWGKRTMIEAMLASSLAII